MFSATKFLIAGAIVALIGGYLLTGPLTQQPSDVPSAAGATGSPGPATELPPGVDLVTEEIEPGVVRVISDGHRAISPTGIDSRVIVRNDGRVWIVVSQGFYELGRGPIVEFPGQDFMTSDDQVTVGPDGDFYKLLGWRPQSWKPAKKHELWRYDGSGWAREELEPGSARVDRLWAAPDGSLRATKGGEDFQRLDRGWVRIADTADGGQGGTAATREGGTQPLVRPGWNLEGTCAGLDRLDGEVLDHYLTDLCIYDFASAPDGRIWVTANDDPDEETLGDLYIIDPSVSAQSEEATAKDWTYFTWTSSDAGASVHNDGGTWRASGQTLEATDPRASGVLDMAWNATGGGPDDRGLSLWEFRFELTNEDGSWLGSGSTVASHEGGDEGPETSIEPWRLQGTGAYEGLTLVMITTNRDSD